MGAIRMNQTGYLPKAKKRFVYLGESKAYHILNLKDHQVVYKGQLKDPIEDAASGDQLCVGDFSDLEVSGHYQMVIGDSVEDFKIDEKRIQPVLDALLKAFYYQRCGVALDHAYAHDWHHNTCHLQPSYLYDPDAEARILSGDANLKVIDTSGGWHDAGDYGRYIVAAAKAVADLLLAYDHFPDSLKEPMGIPESSKNGSDLLHEVRYELEFMLKMQREDGGVYTKVATRFFPGMIMPEDDQEPLFVFDVSTPATGCFAGALALAARVMKSFDGDFSKVCLEASKRAYQWLRHNKEPRLFTNPENINSGEYGDHCDTDERYWACAELYSTTGEAHYHEDFKTYASRLEDKMSLGWADMGGYGTMAYCFTKQDTDAALLAELKSLWLKHADAYVARSQADGYGVTLGEEDYIWGSNMVLLNQAMHLIVANAFKENKAYIEGVMHNWDYLFGMNPMDVSYVTGLGKRPIVAPHHRPSDADGVVPPVPGLVSGGPCAGLYDPIATKMCSGQPKAKCFIDHVDSYATNEVTIYWNSPAVFVAAFLASPCI